MADHPRPLRLDEIDAYQVWRAVRFRIPRKRRGLDASRTPFHGSVLAARCVFCGGTITSIRPAVSSPAVRSRCEEMIAAHALSCGRRWLHARMRAGDSNVLHHVLMRMGVIELAPAPAVAPMFVELAVSLVEARLRIERMTGASDERLDSLIGLLEVLCGPSPERSSR